MLVRIDLLLALHTDVLLAQIELALALELLMVPLVLWQSIRHIVLRDADLEEQALSHDRYTVFRMLFVVHDLRIRSLLMGDRSWKTSLRFVARMSSHHGFHEHADRCRVQLAEGFGVLEALLVLALKELFRE